MAPFFWTHDEAAAAANSIHSDVELFLYVLSLPSDFSL